MRVKHIFLLVHRPAVLATPNLSTFPNGRKTGEKFHAQTGLCLAAQLVQVSAKAEIIVGGPSGHLQKEISVTTGFFQESIGFCRPRIYLQGSVHRGCALPP